MKKATIVIGLQFGDEGKGITVDYLCSQAVNQSGTKSIVVRFSGGQQAGHTVNYNGVKHIHSNFGSGTLRGVPSYFSEHCTFYPNTILNEKEVLADKGIVNPRLLIHPLAKLTTPFDVAYNRIREKELTHGSCGLGVGATMKRNIETPYKLFAIDLGCHKILNQKLKSIKNYYYNLGYQHSDEYLKIVNSEFERFDEAINLPILSIAGYDELNRYNNIIFEGSQGIMLDMDHGIFPNVTYANTTSKNAIEICEKIGIIPEIYYVTRCYQTRHGQGYMSHEGDVELVNNEEEINVFNEWQQHFRTGRIDYSMLNYALGIDQAYHRNLPIIKNLVVTCLDQRPDFNFEIRKMYSTFNKVLESHSSITNFKNDRSRIQ